MAKREWSAKLPNGAASVIVMHSPMSTGENMVHAWEALAAAERGESPDRNRMYAQARLAEIDAILKQYENVKIKYRKLFDAELAELRAACA